MNHSAQNQQGSRFWMTAQRTVLAAAMVTALGGCAWFGSGSAVKPADLGPNVVNLPVRQAWQLSIPAIKNASIRAQVQGDNVVVAAADGTVVSVNAATGRENWRGQAGKTLQTGVGADGQLAAVVTTNNDLVVFEAGKKLWSKTLTASAFTAPLMAGGRVFVLTADRSVSAFDAQNGAHLWTQKREGEPLVLRQQGVLMPYGNTLLAGLSGRLVAFNPDNGNVQWEAPLASPRGTNDVERLVDLVGPASRVGNAVCARAFQATVGCVDANVGRTAWTQTAKGAVGIATDAEYVFGTESNGIVQAWSLADGEKRWSVDRFQHRKLTAPLVLGRAVVMADESGLVHMLSRKDGAHLNRLNTDGTGVAVAPVVAADTLVVVTRGGGIYGFRPD
ncbi:Outer membrane protein assembly factor BamB precursor [compost metagenome]